MPNTFNYAAIFQTALDKQILAEAVTGYMEAAATQIRYNGGATVKLPSIATDGLATYNRTTGHVAGNVTLTWQDYTLTQDRGRSFQIDAMDVDETAFLATAGNVLGEFQRLQVVPEIDAYRLAKLAGLATAATFISDQTATDLTDDLWLDALLDDLAAVRERVGEGATLNVHLSSVTRRKLSASAKATNYFSDATLTGAGNLDTRLQTVDGALIRITPQNRLNSAVTISATNGFTLSGDPLRWLIVAQGAPIAVSKTDTPRVFDPLTNQTANAWKIDYRKYHDIWVPTQRLVGLHVNVPGAE